MTLRLGQTAPDFEQDTANGSIRFHAWLGASWCVLLSHPRNFMPVVATEIAAVARLAPEWSRRGAKVICLSSDTAENHIAWAADVEETQGCAIDFPMIADSDRSVSTLYGMADAAENTHGIFLIDPAKLVRLVMAYPASTGCNFSEILRTIDSLQLADTHGVATPADWIVGQDVFIAPGVSDAEAAVRFAGGWTGPRPYLRVVAQPASDPDRGTVP
jgi:alkyl hydroperoxide reductase subunit AhpC